MTNKHMKRYSISLVNREMQKNKHTKCHFINVRMARTKTFSKINVDEDVVELEPFVLLVGM
jgi:hypothetical protein